ncbi:MAG TPA: NAD(P)-dependent oxidoreductase [Blastocatellia bacterium]|nr:NAD(P)-dependent oxidoreductase [Blastocatellia bacterium]
MNIGFIGLGNMGQAMARKLIAAGHTVTVYNRTRSRAEELQSEGATVAGSPADACRGEAVITMLADDRVVAALAFGAKGIATSLKPGSVHISMSTISVGLSRRLAETHSASSTGFVAAPVFGRPSAAEAGQLFIVAAGEQTLLERVGPLFEAMGQKTFVVGDEPSKANVVKIVGNFMLATVIESLGEAFALGGKAGVEPGTLLEILTGTIFPAPVFKSYGSMIAQQKFEPAGFKLSLGLKDVKLALEASDLFEVPLPLASLIRDRFIASMSRGRREWDWSGLAKLSTDDAGIGKF